MTASDEILIIKTEQRIRRGQKLRVENDFDAIVTIVKELATSEGTHDGVCGVVDDVVGGDRRQD